jgi:hypothetical protein
MRKIDHNWWTRSGVFPARTFTKCTWSNKTLPKRLGPAQHRHTVGKRWTGPHMDGSYWIGWMKHGHYSRVQTLLQDKLRRSKELVEMGTMCGPWACSHYYSK